ncbi:hypothetical protein WJX72_001217 [[Myrmecia] bisecta]|uniref:Methylated-DNA-[protein]-cysteine S-methyltransferase DNA binding domain-containing protein n=1 Tax=[Myrmecia] bisecta TaxID=41462 RepID=A0AAW1PRN4_9CHLO
MHAKGILRYLEEEGSQAIHIYLRDGQNGWQREQEGTGRLPNQAAASHDETRSVYTGGVSEGSLATGDGTGQSRKRKATGGSSRYRQAISDISAGSTRTFAEVGATLSQAAGPGSASGAARAVNSVPTKDIEPPWHRVVHSNGALASKPARRKIQLERLQQEGARPNAGEAIAAWAARVGAIFVGSYHAAPLREYVPARDPRAEAGSPSEQPVAMEEEPAHPAETRQPVITKAQPSNVSEPPEEPAAPGEQPVVGVDQVTAAEKPPAVGEERATPDKQLPAGPAVPVATPGPDVDDLWPTRPTFDKPLEDRLREVDWEEVQQNVMDKGVHVLQGLLSPFECGQLLHALKTIHTRGGWERTLEQAMEGEAENVVHFMKGALPEPLASLRPRLYQHLLPAAQALYPALSNQPVSEGDLARKFPPSWEEYRRGMQTPDHVEPYALVLCQLEGDMDYPSQEQEAAALSAFQLQAFVMLSSKRTDFAVGGLLVQEETTEGSKVRSQHPLE